MCSAILSWPEPAPSLAASLPPPSDCTARPEKKQKTKVKFSPILSPPPFVVTITSVCWLLMQVEEKSKAGGGHTGDKKMYIGP